VHLTRGSTQQLRRFSKDLEPRLDKLEMRWRQHLQQNGFDKVNREAITPITPLAAARLLLARKTAANFLEQVAAAGRRLANLNVTPDQIALALSLCNDLIGPEPTEYQAVRQKLGFDTILEVNRAYYEIREAESKALYDLYRLEMEAPNTDVLARCCIEAMAQFCGAAAAHFLVLADDGQHWQLQASTARAVSPQSPVVVAAPAVVRNGLSKRTRVSRPDLILDAGWRKYSSVWSVPVNGGVLQFAFSSDRNLLPRELDMLAAAGERCRSATQKSRLIEETAGREEQLRLLINRMLIVEENERRRISRELHDDAGQSLVVIRLQMEMIEQSLPPENEARERLAEARDLTEKTILDIRRLISDLSPAVLQHMGLGAALRQLVHRFRDRYPSQVHLNIGDLPKLDTNFQLVIYRLVQECFNNIAQHSQADTVKISLSTTDKVLRLEVQDDGIGFHVNEALSRKDCFGLAGIIERVGILGGDVSIESTPKQGRREAGRKKIGSSVKIDLPIA
jgi:signal transduction histidine kinase